MRLQGICTCTRITEYLQIRYNESKKKKLNIPISPIPPPRPNPPDHPTGHYLELLKCFALEGFARSMCAKKTELRKRDKQKNDQKVRMLNVCMCVKVYLTSFLRGHTHLYAYMQTGIQTERLTGRRTNTNLNIQTCIHIHTYIQTCLHSYLRSCIRTYTHTYMHA